MSRGDLELPRAPDLVCSTALQSGPARGQVRTHLLERSSKGSELGRLRWRRSDVQMALAKLLDGLREPRDVCGDLAQEAAGQDPGTSECRGQLPGACSRSMR